MPRASITRIARPAAAVIAWCCLPLGALLVFALVQIAIFAYAQSGVPGSAIPRAMPGFWNTQFISDPDDVEGSWAGHKFLTYNQSIVPMMFADLRAVLTLDPNVVGGTRREAMRIVRGGYAAAMAIAAASVAAGLAIGGWACRLLLRPSYWTLAVMARERRRIFRRSILPAVLWAYPVMVPLAAIDVLLFDTYGAGFVYYSTPSLAWAVVLLCSPAASASVSVVRGYSRAVRSRIGAADHRCDCEYECGPGVACPECGKTTRGLPARLRWRWRV